MGVAFHLAAPFQVFYDEKSSSLTRARAASKGVAPMASHAVIDQCVWRFEWECTWYEIPFICLFFH